MYSLIKILIADDHAVIRTGLKFLIQTNFDNIQLGEADSCRNVIEKLHAGSYTHLIADLQLGDANFVEYYAQINQSFPELYTLIYSMSPEQIFAKRLTAQGALGFLSKQSSEDEIIRALSLFFKGKPYISKELQAEEKYNFNQKEKTANPFDELSERELAVAYYIVNGSRVKEIATKLNLGITTVATYKARVFEKLGINNNMDLKELANLHQMRSY